MLETAETSGAVIGGATHFTKKSYRPDDKNGERGLRLLYIAHPARRCHGPIIVLIIGSSSGHGPAVTLE